MASRGSNRITSAQEEYLALLRSAIWGTEVVAVRSDIKAILAIANMQKTRPLILLALQKAGCCTADKQTQAFIHKTAASHINLNRTIARTVTALRDAGIDPVLLKGQGVAQNYPDPMLRECGDIDLYVGKDNYAKACEVAKGLATESEAKDATESSKHFHIWIYGLCLEIHRVSEVVPGKRQNEFYQQLSDRGLSKDLVPVVFDGVPVNTPADSFNAFYIFHHAWHHFQAGGIGLRQVCDWMLFLHSRAGKLDTSVIESALDNLHLRKPWQVFASIAVDYLGLPATEMPFYNPDMKGISSKALALILEEGNFGHFRKEVGKRPAGYVAGKAHSVKGYLTRTFKLCRIFPKEGLAHIPQFFYNGFKQVFVDIMHK